MKNNYLFTSARLGFRNWSKADLVEFAELNADQEVMKHFPKPLSRKETQEFIDRLILRFEIQGYCYFATEIVETGEFIGMIGITDQEFESEFTPATDIGWRLKKSAWGNGYATEGAERCLEYAFDTLKKDKIISTCTSNNKSSENVMKKIGMVKVGEFNHPYLKDYPKLEKCLCYEITLINWKKLQSN